jgi:outer membrane protein, heavy metal efflux system
VSRVDFFQLRPGRARIYFLVAAWAALDGIIPQLKAQSELPSPQLLRVPSARMPETRLESLEFDLRRGIGPDEAGVIAAYLNPALRSTRDRRGLAVAQLIQAGVLPNPQISYTRDYVTGGNTAGTTNAFNFNSSWEVTSLLPLLPKQTAARANLRSVDLDIAWNEWQIVESARLAVYRVIALRDQLSSATEADRELTQSAETLKLAVEKHEKTVLDYGAAEAASQDARATALGLAQEDSKQRLGLKKILGVPPEAEVRLRPGIGFPSHLDVPSQEALVDGLETRRLDLLALQQGYHSQDANVRAAIMEQFPKISLGFGKASDTTDVHTSGFAVTIDVPIFNRNQGGLATERATRQKLLDEYHLRVFEAHSDIATALSDIRWLNRQVAAAEEALPIFERLVKSAETAMQEGHTDVLAYYTARSGLIQRRVLLVKLKELLLEAQTALEIASGRFIPSNRTVHLK